MSTLSDLIATRQTTHGNFTDTSKCAQRLKEDLRAWGPNWDRMEPYQSEALDMICQKLARVATGDPMEPDHWIDLAGYSTMVVDRLKGATTMWAVQDDRGKPVK